MARAPRPAGLRPDAPPRSYARSARMELLMSPDLKQRIREAAAADGRPVLPWILDVVERALPPRLDDEAPSEETQMAS